MEEQKSNHYKLKGKNVVILHQNIDRLSNKLDWFSHFLSSLNPYIVVLNERGLNNDTIE